MPLSDVVLNVFCQVLPKAYKRTVFNVTIGLWAFSLGGVAKKAQNQKAVFNVTIGLWPFSLRGVAKKHKIVTLRRVF